MLVGPTFEENNIDNLKKQGFWLLYDPEISLLGIYQEGQKHNAETYLHSMFMTALFILARTGNKLKCPRTSVSLNKLWYVYTMKYFIVLENT